jgi:hypothetical protein
MKFCERLTMQQQQVTGIFTYQYPTKHLFLHQEQQNGVKSLRLQQQSTNNRTSNFYNGMEIALKHGNRGIWEAKFHNKK